MRHLTDVSGSINDKLSLLNEKTGNVTSVVASLEKVADQINLLSLNAAIEAEKAGEFGLGFAVVAAEIRRMADQTAVTAHDIGKIVREMQSAVATGVMGMDKFCEEARRGAEEARQVGMHLAQIIRQAQSLAPRFEAVDGGIQAHASGARQIGVTVARLSEVARRSADSLRQSEAAITELDGAARGLQAGVARFKPTIPVEG